MRFEIRKSSNNKFYWVFIAGNNEVVCTSQILKSKQAAKKSIRAAKKAWRAKIVDKSLWQ
jgi:uncharacterized protein YegP (UPF0339 family)